MSIKNLDRTGSTVAIRSGVVAFGAAVVLLWFDARLSIIPLAVFTLLCFVATFLPRFSFYLPIISRGNASTPAVALTFDDGPDPLSTPALLKILSRHRVRATFFVNGKKVLTHPELVKEIVQKGHTIGNHTYTHDNLILLKTGKLLLNDIFATQKALHSLGVVSFVFRPPVGFTNPRLGQILRNLNLYTVNFSCRAFDFGNRRILNLSRKIIRKAQPNDIVLLHDIPPKRAGEFENWLREIELLITGLETKGLSIIPLAELIGKPVMKNRAPRRE